ncbi:Alpha/Beta hydrolase protein [Bisporella sp. PMI_857]|nr:Alpha/Beta hydrolase protein [Bisporella sp. PMI_857]
MLSSIWNAGITLLASVALTLATPVPELTSTTKPTTPTVKVKNGTYFGVHSSQYNQDFFLGVPFAEPPVGDLRFRVPRPLNTTWKGTKSATTYSASCVGYGGDNLAYASQSEDCLYLNVVRPSGYEHERLPVAFWIHGGGLTMGSGIDQRYNLSFIVERSVKIGKPIIGVSINYRVDMWGFINGDEVLKTGNTNLGFRDQRLALHWAQENILAFGGDPDKVTIWGESAGGLSVGMHLTAYGGRNDRLFSGAIMESGNPVYYGSFNHNDSSFAYAAASLGCNSAKDKLQCLRKIPFETLNAWINGTGAAAAWNPVIDGDFIQGRTSLQLAKGQFVHVPIISGANEEGTAFGPAPVETEQDFVSNLETRAFPTPLPSPLVSKVLSAYPTIITGGAVPTNMPPGDVHPFGTNYRRSAAYYGDATMIAHRRLTCQTWANFNLAAYCYRFNTVPNGIPTFISSTHFQEVAFVFNNKDGVGYGLPQANPFYQMPHAFLDSSDQISEAWINFVSTGNPGNWWPMYEKGVGHNYVFDANVTGLGYPEADVWRWDGIALINSWNADVYNR